MGRSKTFSQACGCSKNSDGSSLRSARETGTSCWGLTGPTTRKLYVKAHRHRAWRIRERIRGPQECTEGLDSGHGTVHHRNTHSQEIAGPALLALPRYVAILQA